jgi:hypothetical protein
MMPINRRHFVSLLVVGILAGLFSALVLVVCQSKVSPQAIASSVIRTPELVERAWRLPVTATFNRQITWQSNIDRRQHKT